MPVLWKKGLRAAAALMTLGAGALSAQTAVRKAAWGMTQAQVMASEVANPPASARSAAKRRSVMIPAAWRTLLHISNRIAELSGERSLHSIGNHSFRQVFGIGNRVRALEALYAVDCARDHHPPRPHRREPPNHASNRVAACRGKGGPSLDRNPYDQASRRVGTRQAESSRHDRRYHKQLSFWYCCYF